MYDKLSRQFDAISCKVYRSLILPLVAAAKKSMRHVDVDVISDLVTTELFLYFQQMHRRRLTVKCVFVRNIYMPSENTG